MVIIRLTRHGRKNAPFFHITVANQSAKLTGRFIEKVGFYNPQRGFRHDELVFDMSRIHYWLNNGAKLSDRVRDLLKKSPDFVFPVQVNKVKKIKNKKPLDFKNTIEIITESHSEINGLEFAKNSISNIIEFREQIRKIDKYSDIVNAEVRTLENQSIWGSITNTSSLVPLANDVSLTYWSNYCNDQPIVFKSLYRYMLVNRVSGKISWARIAKTRITFFCDSIAWVTPTVINNFNWKITYLAEWNIEKLKQSNMTIKLYPQHNYSYDENDSSYLALKVWFGLSELIILSVDVVGISRVNEKLYDSFKSYISANETDFKKLILNHVSQPFKYSAKLTGVQAKDFFGSSYGRYRIRAALLNKYPILSVE